jgi:hypothetical protein
MRSFALASVTTAGAGARSRAMDNDVQGHETVPPGASAVALRAMGIRGWPDSSTNDTSPLQPSQHVNQPPPCIRHNT